MKHFVGYIFMKFIYSAKYSGPGDELKRWNINLQLLLLIVTCFGTETFQQESKKCPLGGLQEKCEGRWHSRFFFLKLQYHFFVRVCHFL